MERRSLKRKQEDEASEHETRMSSVRAKIADFEARTREGEGGGGGGGRKDSSKEKNRAFADHDKRELAAAHTSPHTIFIIAVSIAV